MCEVVGTPGYWAPEVACVTARCGYGWEADIWSTGLTIYDMALNRLTAFYAAESTGEIRRQMMLYDVPLWSVGNDLLKDLLSNVRYHHFLQGVYSA